MSNFVLITITAFFLAWGTSLGFLATVGEYTPWERRGLWTLELLLIVFGLWVFTCAV